MWNDFEIKLVNVVDKLAPICEFKEDQPISKPNVFVKNKINIRHRLLKQQKMVPTLNLKTRIKNLSFEIKTHFYSERKNQIRKKLVPGNSKSLWNAVRAARDIGSNSLPSSLLITMSHM